MNSYPTIEEARAAATHAALTIIEIDPAPGTHPYILAKCDIDTLRRAIARKPMPEIRKVIGQVADLVADRKAAEKTANKARLDADIADGVAFRSAEIADQYGGSIQWARRIPVEDYDKWSDWYRTLGMHSYAGSHIEVDPEAIRQVVEDRQSDGQFPGCTNAAWTITAEEWDAILAADREIKAAKAKTVALNEAAHNVDIRRKVAAGYCFACESYCHGDCGRYSTDPEVLFRRQLQDANRESRYGIND